MLCDRCDENLGSAGCSFEKKEYPRAITCGSYKPKVMSLVTLPNKKEEISKSFIYSSTEPDKCIFYSKGV